MKLKTILIGSFICSLLLSSCTIDRILSVSDHVTTKHVHTSSFTKLEVSNGFNTYITFSDSEERVEIEANENLHQYVAIKNNEGKLTIRIKDNFKFIGEKTLNLYITTAKISDFNAHNDTKISLDNLLVGNNIKISLSDDSSFYGEIDVDNLELRVHRDSKVDLYGNVNNLDADLSEDSSLTDYDLTVRDLTIELSDDSKAYLTVTDYIDIDAHRDSYLYYKGDAVITHEHITGGSKIRKR